jgi:DNA-binding NtrC family response regulator
MGQSQPLRRTTALVIEDDEDQRFLAVTLFEQGDFQVIECETAEQGLDVIRKRPDDVELILTDVELPGKMDGIDFANIVHAELPHVPVIVTSGAGGERIAELPPGVEFLPKPWRSFDLLMLAERARVHR